jgi:putative transposase
MGTDCRSRTALAAEKFFLRKQLPVYGERQVKPRRASDLIRLTLILLARCCAWREALTIVPPATLLRWHREVFQLCWREPSRPRRPRLPAELQRRIAAMARDNATWGEERIDAELPLPLGRPLSPHTIHRDISRGRGGGGRGVRGQRRATFVDSHARAPEACA